jgi:mercuric ion transport protein
LKGPGSRSLLGIGIAGSVIAALCCFTPVLVVLFGTAGVLGAAAWLDPVLIAALIAFVGLTLFALSRRRQTAKGGDVSKQGR